MVALQPPPQVIKLLAHDLRWQLVQLLSHSDYRVSELVDRLGEPANLTSYHLKKLRNGGLVYTHRSEADGRDTYYSLDLDSLRQEYRQAGGLIHPALVSQPGTDSARPGTLRVLFVCTHNSARSQMAEGLLRHLSGGAIEVYSAGSHPTRVHPEAIRAMDALGVDIRQQESTHIRKLETQPFNYVITVCDRAREVCPTFPGDGAQYHWGLPDPSKIDDEGERRQAFAETARRLQSRIEYFLQTIAEGTPT